MPFFGRITLFDVFIRLKTVTACHSAHLHIKLAVIKQHIRMTNSYFSVFCAFENIFTKARHILTEIHCITVFRFPDLFRRKCFIDLYRRKLHCAKNSARTFYYFCVLPRGIVVIRAFPIAKLKTRVVMLAVSYAVEEYRTLTALPRRIGHYLFGSAVVICQFKLTYHFRPMTPCRRACVPRVVRKAVIPAVAQNDGNRVFSLTKQGFYVIRHI